MNLRFILLMGLVSMFADWLYEGARSIWPQYLAQLGASLALVGFAFGAGDALGYAARLVTGPLADRRGGYWLETFVGYGMQVAAVAALAFAQDPLAGAVLVFLERFSKALRTPARDVLIAAAGGGGRGKAFGIHATVDQLGAVLGVATTTVALTALSMDMKQVFLLLALPGLAALSVLAVARHIGPRGAIRVGGASAPRPQGLVTYYMAMFLLGASLMHVSLAMARLAGEPALGAIIYMAAMAGDLAFSPVLGALYDRGSRALYVGPVAAVAATASLASGSLPAALVGALLFSAATAYADVVAKAHVASGGATALGVAGASYGLGLAFSGVVYAMLVEAGATAWAVALSLFAASTAILLIWIGEGR